MGVVKNGELIQWQAHKVCDYTYAMQENALRFEFVKLGGLFAFVAVVSKAVMWQDLSVADAFQSSPRVRLPHQ